MGFVRNLTGKTAADAAIKGGEIQSAAATDAASAVGIAGNRARASVGRAGQQAGEDVRFAGQQAGDLFNPFSQLGKSGIEQAGFLTDPTAQFDFLQNNPLFQLGLDNANTQTNQFAAARGRLSAGDTLQKLNQNALLTASPLIQQQKQSIGDLLNIGQFATGNQASILQNTAGSSANILQNTAGNQANILQSTAANRSNLLTGAAAAQSAGIVGAANARGAGAANLFGAAIELGAAAISAPAGAGAGAGAGDGASDPLLKTNIVKTGTENGYNTYTWDWNEKANDIGLTGSSAGVMADEVKKITPAAVTINNGYMQVDYDMIGVKH